MNSDDKKKGTAAGFSGLSTLVSDVEDGSPTIPPAAREVVPPSSAAPTPEQPHGRLQGALVQDPPAPPRAQHDSFSDATTGKWMIGIGLGIGFLLIIFVNATQNESTRSPAVTAAQTPTTDSPSYQPPPPAPVIQRQQTTQEAIIQRSAATESVDVLGQQVVFSNPRGYCTLGTSAREVELMDMARRSLGEGARLMHAAVLCSELEDYRLGRRDTLDHWLQIQLLGAQGNFQRVEMAREDFLSGLSQSSPRVNADELNRRLSASLETSDISLSDTKFEPIGRDGNAVYFAMQMNINVGESSRVVTGIGGTTLLNALPLSINVYEGDGSPQSRGQLQALQQELLQSLLTEN